MSEAPRLISRQSTWNSPDDPENPYNWLSWSKITIGVIFSLGQLMTLMSASMITTTLSDLPRFED